MCIIFLFYSHDCCGMNCTDYSLTVPSWILCRLLWLLLCLWLGFWLLLKLILLLWLFDHLLLLLYLGRPTLSSSLLGCGSGYCLLFLLRLHFTLFFGNNWLLLNFLFALLVTAHRITLLFHGWWLDYLLRPRRPSSSIFRSLLLYGGHLLFWWAPISPWIRPLTSSPSCIL